MKIVLFIYVLGSIVIACSNERSKKRSFNNTGKYDLEKDTSVFSGEMKRYWLVLLKKGPNRNQDSISAEKIQAAHMANINRLAKEGKLIMAGPIGIEDDLRGFFL
jgi:hypothetical protein